MIGTVITGRGNNREVIERPRNLGFSQALGKSIKLYLGNAYAKAGNTQRADAMLRGAGAK